jgi:hypothetical protein
VERKARVTMPQRFLVQYVARRLTLHENVAKASKTYHYVHFGNIYVRWEWSLFTKNIMCMVNLTMFFVKVWLQMCTYLN